MVYKYDSIRQLLSSFEECQKKFNSNVFNNIESGYLASISNIYLNTSLNKIKNNAAKIKKYYDGIINWWTKYLEDLVIIENCLSNDGNPNSLHATPVASLLNSFLDFSNEEVFDKSAFENFNSNYSEKKSTASVNDESEKVSSYNDQSLNGLSLEGLDGLSLKSLDGLSLDGLTGLSLEGLNGLENLDLKNLKNFDISGIGNFGASGIGNFGASGIGNFDASGIGNFDASGIGNFNASGIGNFSNSMIGNFNSSKFGNFSGIGLGNFSGIGIAVGANHLSVSNLKNLKNNNFSISKASLGGLATIGVIGLGAVLNKINNINGAGINGGMMTGGIMTGGMSSMGSSLTSGIGGVGALTGIGRGVLDKHYSNQYNGKSKFKDSYIFSLVKDIIPDELVNLNNTCTTISSSGFNSSLKNGMILFSNVIGSSGKFSQKTYKCIYNKKHEISEKEIGCNFVSSFDTNIYRKILEYYALNR